MTPVFKEGDVIGEYVIEQCLGGGAHDQIYAAHYKPLGIRRALKVLVAPPELVEARRSRFLAESRLLANLDHPRILRVHDLAIDEERKLPYFTMDYVVSPTGSPRTLDEARRAGLSEVEVMGWFRDLCEGLDYIHSKGLVHRDVTLANILINVHGHAMLADFGLARIFDRSLSRFHDLSIPDEELASPTRVGSIMYLAPEVRNGGPTSPASDAWSLGVVLFRLVTGYWFDAHDRDLYLQMTEDLDCPWRKVEERLLSPDPSARIPEKGLVELARIIEDGYVPLEERVNRMIRRERCLIAAASVAFVGAIAAGLWFWLRPPSETPPTGQDATPAVASSVAEGKVFALPRPDPSAPRWDDRESNGYAALDESVILANLDKFPPEVAEALRHALDRAISFYGYVQPYGLSEIDGLSSWIDSEMAAGKESSANPAQLLLLVGEVHRYHRLNTLGGGLESDSERLAELTLRFLNSPAVRGRNAEWAYETVLEGNVAECLQALRRIRNADPMKVSWAEQWLLKMLGIDADILASAAIRSNRSSEEMGYRDRSECENLLQNAHIGLHEAALYFNSDSHAAARHFLRASIGDADRVAEAFADCRRLCFDDLRDWDRCARSLLTRWGAPKGLVEQLLDAALESGTDDSWLPAFYVLGRWRILARYESPSGWNADADHRAWAYEDAEVRAKTLAVIRSFKDSPLLNNAPEMRRQVVIANFAAVALVCGDESLARELVARLPLSGSGFLLVMREIVSSDTNLFKRLDALHSDIAKEGGL